MDKDKPVETQNQMKNDGGVKNNYLIYIGLLVFLILVIVLGVILKGNPVGF
jgi:hypothetical protein